MAASQTDDRRCLGRCPSFAGNNQQMRIPALISLLAQQQTPALPRTRQFINKTRPQPDNWHDIFSPVDFVSFVSLACIKTRYFIFIINRACSEDTDALCAFHGHQRIYILYSIKSPWFFVFQSRPPRVMVLWQFCHWGKHFRVVLSQRLLQRGSWCPQAGGAELPQWCLI